MKKLLAPLLLAAPLLTGVPGCAPYLEVETDWNPQFVGEMSGYRTFAWLETAEGVLPYESMEEDRIGDAIARHLTRRGFVPASGDATPDFRVAWYYTVEDRVRVSSYRWYDQYWGSPWYGNTWVDQWQEGVLVIDIVDTEAGELVWRGVANSEIVDYDDPTERIRRIRKVVDEVLAGFPPQGPMPATPATVSQAPVPSP